ncbi:MAG: HlyD family secretion protein [Bdellovibrionales bacterium]
MVNHSATAEDLEGIKIGPLKWWQSSRAKKTGLVLSAVAIAGILIWRFAFYPYVSTDDARVAMTVVRVAPSGTGGRVIKVNATEGQGVKSGDLLVEIDHRIPQARLNRAKAKAELARRELDRMELLAKQNSITPQNLDVSRASYESAAAELQEAEVTLENTSLNSPFDGVVIQKVAEVGNILEPGQTALSVADVKNAWISANVEETSVGLVKTGQPVTIEIDEGGSMRGRVTEIRSATAAQFALIPSDNASGNFTKVVQRIPIKVALEPDQAKSLRVGQSVVIKIRVH